MDRAIYDRMAQIDEHHWWFVGRRAIIRAVIDRFFPARRDLRVLEVGAGTGSNLAMLRDYGGVDAIEPDDEARAFAERRSGLAIKGGYLPDVPLDDASYDLVVLLDVLEHIPDDLGALQALRPKLKAGGKLLLTVPAMPRLWSAHDVAHHHHRRYTRRTLATVVQAGGFRPVHVSSFNTWLLPVAE